MEGALGGTHSGVPIARPVINGTRDAGRPACGHSFARLTMRGGSEEPSAQIPPTAWWPTNRAVFTTRGIEGPKATISRQVGVAASRLFGSGWQEPNGVAEMVHALRCDGQSAEV